ncbi:shikimate kinase [Intestinimonas sp.]|uniref:shikimate kinase n=1 Tax=Intestinimonas sp. TaxID=1965293 RepID=UPI00260D3E0E|nr:shikimate kinase [Intestinimonas sp.]
METRNIVLIGMMASGKTTVGGLLAARLGRTLADTDALIEAREGRTIPAIFAADGEGYFRDRERETAEVLARRTGLVIACGGGLPLRAAAMAPLKASGVVFWLCRDPGRTYDTVSMAGRPLAQEGKAAFLDRFAQREPVYRQWADHIIPEAPSPEAAADAILEVLRA